MWNSARQNSGRLSTVGGELYINFSGRHFRKLRAGYKNVPASTGPGPWTFTPGIGFWRINTLTTVSNVPSDIINAGETAITFPSWVPFLVTDIDGNSGWGPIIHDFETGKNYLYVQLKSTYSGWRWWFLEINNSFVATRIVPVESQDTILNAKAAILEL